MQTKTQTALATVALLAAAAAAWADGPTVDSYAPSARKGSIVSSLATMSAPSTQQSATPGIELPHIQTPGQLERGDALLQVPNALGMVPCPAIPDADDLNISAEQQQRIEAGEIVVSIIEEGVEDRQVRAIGYLKADPVSLFDFATDSTLAPELLSMVKKVDVLEQSDSGKTFRGSIKPSMLLPTYRYTLSSRYRGDHTGQCWGQLEGDFDRNEGAHSFLWNPERGETLAVFTFYLSLRGVLSLLPESWVLNGAANTLPEFMKKLERLAQRQAETDPERATRNTQSWRSLRARIEAGDLPNRVWRPLLAQAAPDDQH